MSVVLPLQSAALPRMQFTRVSECTAASSPLWTIICGGTSKNRREKQFQGIEELINSFLSKLNFVNETRSPHLDRPVAAERHVMSAPRRKLHLLVSLFISSKILFSCVCRRNLIWANPSLPLRQFVQQRAPKVTVILLYLHRKPITTYSSTFLLALIKWQEKCYCAAGFFLYPQMLSLLVKQTKCA